ncbi:MAG: VRR-NUC domain-containing protein [Gammaproteobacteria bacterium]|nr:VRR-NUC domain-containing protein [Gammaproteobacteria bacterium]
MSAENSYDQTHWAPVKRRGPLPTFYYHEHFMEMLEFVSRHYAHVLLEQHADLIRQFRALSRPAQCLYVRLVNRKGRVFAANKLRYPELGDARTVLRELTDEGWAGAPQQQHYLHVLSHLTKAEISRVLLPMFTGMSRSLKKNELVQFAIEHCSADEFMARLNTDRLLVQRRVDDIRYLLFLYFGRIQDGLSQFTMRDLGLVRTQDFSESYEPRYSDRAEAQQNYFYSLRLHRMNSSGQSGLVALLDDTSNWPEPDFASSASARDKLAYKLGRELERSGDAPAARRIYALGESPRCSERLVRVMLALGERDDAERLLLRCIESPRSEDEAIMAEDLYARKFQKKRTSIRTDELRASETIDIDEANSGSPERAAIDYFERQGLVAYRTENLLWRTYLGLLFWDDLFADGNATLHSPFDFLPSSLADGTFYTHNRERIESRLAIIGEPRVLKKELLRTSTANYGKANGVFRWRRSILDALFAFIDNAATEPCRRMLRRLCQEYKDARYGYPDLMVLDTDGVRFVEIKAEGDQLRQNQLLRQQQLRDAGFRADVVRIRWILDPDQAYVVVDVETTGGRGDQHRVTEVGAVKIINGVVVDRFQTLLNPQRAIPAGITRLTGISAEMVADAPLFSDIADEFEAFMQDAIFVAHNVDFDYGFIAREFKRLGRPFRHPKLCTCSSMRKLYPGHKSYSLAALCENYGIALRQHHRALCDAEAAAELLLLINEKRAAGC